MVQAIGIDRQIRIPIQGVNRYRYAILQPIDIPTGIFNRLLSRVWYIITGIRYTYFIYTCYVIYIRACHGPTLVGRPGPARPTNFLYDGPRPDPARQIFRRWAAARPGPSFFETFRPGPWISMGRLMCCSVPKRACAHYADVKF